MPLKITDDKEAPSVERPIGSIRRLRLAGIGHFKGSDCARLRTGTPAFAGGERIEIASERGFLVPGQVVGKLRAMLHALPAHPSIARNAR